MISDSTNRPTKVITNCVTTCAIVGTGPTRMLPSSGTWMPNSIMPTPPAIAESATSGATYPIHTSAAALFSALITGHSLRGVSRMFLTRAMMPAVSTLLSAAVAAAAAPPAVAPKLEVDAAAAGAGCGADAAEGAGAADGGDAGCRGGSGVGL